MSHMVIYRGTDGKPAYHEVEEIHDAVSFVEQLRNDQGVEHATIHRMEQVNFEYRPYFRVELRSGSGELNSGGPAPAAVSAAPPAVSAPEPVAAPSSVPATEVAAAPAEAPAATSAPTESAPPATESDTTSSDADNGVGARRGLFGR